MTDLTQQMETLARRLDALEVENSQLREQLDGAPESGPVESRRFGRRNLLRLGGAAAAVGAGSVLLRPGVAGAAAGGSIVMGAENVADATKTGLTSSNATDTLHVENSGDGEAIEAHISKTDSNSWVVHGLQDGTSDAVVGEITNAGGNGAGVVGLGVDGGGVVGVSFGFGAAVAGIAFSSDSEQGVLAWVTDATNVAPSVEAVQQGKGHGVYSHIENTASTKNAARAATNGTGNAVLASIANTHSSASSVKGTTTGSGAGVEGSSSSGFGGRFAGKAAQVYLVPSSASTHPSTGSPGRLFVDKTGRLWYCYATNKWKQLA